MTDRLIGTSVGHYDVVEKVGGGGMGVVYKARDRRLERFVALKFLPSQWSHDEQAKLRFVREAQAASATEHPSICTIYNIDEAPDGQLFIVMAYYDGVTLKERLTRGPLAVEEALEIATQVAQGLARAHKAGVVHRDLKPSNLILTDDAVKIVDFGLAKFADAQQLTVSAPTPIGTYAYMSPEQTRAEEASPRSDVWAVGVLIYEMLAGRPPFGGGYFEAVAHAIRHQDPPPLRAVRPDVSEALERLVFRAMHKDSAVRFADGRALAVALLHLRGLSAPLDLNSGVVEVPRHLVEPRQAPSRGARPVFAIAGAAAVVLAGAVAWNLTAGPRAPRETVNVVPVLNQSGYPELDPYRLALTAALVGELQTSPSVRPVDDGAVAMLARDMMRRGADPAGPDLMQRLAAIGRGRWILVPTVLHDQGAWSARVEIRDARTGAAVNTLRTAGVASSLNREAAYGQVVELARAVATHFAGSQRVPTGRLSPGARLRSLDAVHAIEEGVAAMEQLNYARARDAFARAAEAEQRHPLPHAWLSRAEGLLRHGNEAAEAADRAVRLLTEATADRDRLFAQAVAATSRNDPSEARARHDELVRRFPDESRWRAELAGYLDGQGHVDEAIQEYQRIAPEARTPRVAVELCRLYARRDDRARARDAARVAAESFMALGAPLGVAQARLCEADVLRRGTPEEKRAGLQASADALGMFDAEGDAYNVARAHHFVALALVSEGREPDALTSWERALAGARATSNAVLEAGTLNNLGLATLALGRRRESLRYLEEATAANERIGDERQAAGAQVNSATILVQFGPDAEEGLRRVESALTVFRTIGDRTGELFAHRVSGEYYRNAGRFDEANVAFAQALAIAGERGLRDDTLGIWMEMAIGRLAVGDYGQALDLLDRVLADSSNRDLTRAAILRGVTRARLGDMAGADQAFAGARRAMGRAGDIRFEPLLLVAEAQSWLERGERARARTLFERAARVPPDELADDNALAAAAYTHVLRAGPAAGRIAAIEALKKDTRGLGRVDLSVLLDVLQATIAIDAGWPRVALGHLATDAAVAARLDRELAATAKRLEAVARAAAGDAAGSAAAQAEVARILAQVGALVPERDRAAFSMRPFVVRLRQPLS
jgi:tetratricopeptide (TPR) repeat protein